MKPQALAPQTGRLIEAISRLEDFLDWFIYSDNTIDGQSITIPTLIMANSPQLETKLV